MGDTVVLVTACIQQTPTAGRDFLPLTVNYVEKTYAAGRIPGGFFKREGRPTEKETLTSRLIDRPIRPLFPDGFYNDVQVVATVLSMDPDIDADIPALLGASAALALSGIPFNGPIGAARVGWQDGRYVLNPTAKELAQSQLHLVVAGTEHAVLMVESEAKELSEAVMLGAVVFGHEQMQTAIRVIKELAAEAGKPRWSWQPPAEDAELMSALSLHAQAALAQAYTITEKQQRHARLTEIKTQTLATLAGGDQPKWTQEAVESALFRLESRIVRQRILNGEPRIDGRDTRTVRPITVKVGVMPRTHGSALFTRGETQALVLTTLGTTRDAQIIDALEGERREPFMLHYNFPPFSVGETGMMGAPKRREIGRVALEQARAGRLHILDEMNKVIREPRAKMSEWAPSIITLKIDQEKIRDVIGKGGAVIRQITEETGTTIDIESDGTVKIASVSGAAGREAQRRIELITADVEVGQIYEGKVARLMNGSPSCSCSAITCSRIGRVMSPWVFLSMTTKSTRSITSRRISASVMYRLSTVSYNRLLGYFLIIRGALIAGPSLWVMHLP